jgi:hypothetical protein
MNEKNENFSHLPESWKILEVSRMSDGFCLAEPELD